MLRGWGTSAMRESISDSGYFSPPQMTSFTWARRASQNASEVRKLAILEGVPLMTSAWLRIMRRASTSALRHSSSLANSSVRPWERAREYSMTEMSKDSVVMAQYTEQLSRSKRTISLPGMSAT